MGEDDPKVGVVDRDVLDQERFAEPVRAPGKIEVPVWKTTGRPSRCAAS